MKCPACGADGGCLHGLSALDPAADITGMEWWGQSREGLRMDQRYLPADDDLRGQLDVLQEECAEVIKVCSKIKRFNEVVMDFNTGKVYDNRADLYKEMDDVAAAWARVQRLIP